MAKRGRPPPAKLKELVAAGRLPKPSEGPSAERRRASASFRCVLVARGHGGARAACRVSGGDPGCETRRRDPDAL